MNPKVSTKVLLINPPRTPIGGRIPKVQIPPFDLLRIGSSLSDAGFEANLLDAESNAMSLFDIVRACRKQAPQYVMLETARAAPLHATLLVLCSMLKFAMPNLVIIYVDASRTHRFVELSKCLNC